MVIMTLPVWVYTGEYQLLLDILMLLMLLSRQWRCSHTRGGSLLSQYRVDAAARCLVLAAVLQRCHDASVLLLVWL